MPNAATVGVAADNKAELALDTNWNGSMRFRIEGPIRTDSVAKRV